MPKIYSASCAFPTHGVTCSYESSFPAIVWASLFLESMRPSSRFQSILVVSSHSNLPTLTWLRDDSDTISCSEWISITRWTSARTQNSTNLHASWDFRKKFNLTFADDRENLKTIVLRWSIYAHTTQDSKFLQRMKQTAETINAGISSRTDKSSGLITICDKLINADLWCW